MKTLGRSIAIAALTASAVTVGSVNASAAPAPQQVQTQQVSATTDSAAHSVTATLASGKFVNNVASRSIDVLDAAGHAIETIPLTIEGQMVPIAATISQNGDALTLHQVDTAGTANKLWGQWLWGVNNGGGVGAAVGCLIGWFFFVVGCLVGGAIGGAVSSPNSGDITGTFNDLIAGR